MNIDNTSEFLFYQGKDGNIKVHIILGDETIWTTQNGMADIFGIASNTINYHLKEIYKSEELDENSTTRKIRVVQKEGERDVSREMDFYNLDAILSVGYRVNSYQATQFRKWSNTVLKEYLIKGFAIDDERLKQGKQKFGKDYFEELLERIREIRASERRFYQKITDLYALSVDYDKNSPTTQAFFAVVQNKLEYAITKQTAAEIIKSRSSAVKPHMGLQTWSNSPNGKIIKKDVTVAKNYLNQEEISALNRIVNMYLDHAEDLAARNRVMTMAAWSQRLDAFLRFNEYEILKNAGKVQKAVADAFAIQQYEDFRIVQDKEYESDFDKRLNKRLSEIDFSLDKLMDVLEMVAPNAREVVAKDPEKFEQSIIEMVKVNKANRKKTEEIEKEKSIQQPLSDLNKKLKQALNYNPKEEKDKSPE